MPDSDVRPSPIAGVWYADNPPTLAKDIDTFLDQVQLPDLNGEVMGLIAPHAGYRYSGAVAGYAFSTVRNRTFDLVAVISPMHHPYREPLLTTSHHAYFSPLGNIAVDHVAIEELHALLQEVDLSLTKIAKDKEHSLEIELPFLQRALANPFRLLPVMVRSQDADVCRKLGQALARVLAHRNALLVASTDLSHFYPQETANQLDQTMLKQFLAFQPEGIFEINAQGKGFACGLGAVAAVQWAAKALGADTMKLLKYATSGDVTGEHFSVVGYGAAVLLKS